MCQMCDVATVAWVAQRPEIEQGTVSELDLRCTLEIPVTYDGSLDDGRARAIEARQVLVSTVPRQWIGTRNQDHVDGPARYRVTTPI
jgi:hypothetical protein